MKKFEKMMVIICLCCTVISGVFQGGYNVLAKDVNSTKKAALNAYKNFLSRGSAELIIDSFTLQCDFSQEKFSVKDLNHDGTPELILDTCADHGMVHSAVILTYYHKAIKAVMTCSHGYPNYYKKGSVFSCDYLNRGHNIQGTYQIIKGKVKKVAEVTDDSAAMLDNYEGTVYYVGGKKVDKVKYMNFLKKMTKSTVSSAKALVYHDITNNNIKKYVK